MKRSFLLLFMCVVASMAFSQTTGFMPLQFSTKMMDNTKYWENMHQLFMKGHQYRYVCITCPSSEPESCLVIGDSTLTLITLDKMLYSTLRDKGTKKTPKPTIKTLNVSKRFVINLCNLIDLGSLTSNACEYSRMTDNTTTYFLPYSQTYHSSKTIATGGANVGNEASQLMEVLNQIRDAVAGKRPLAEADLIKTIRDQHKHLFTLLPSNFVDRKLYELD